jgi:hypothetical protein
MKTLFNFNMLKEFPKLFPHLIDINVPTLCTLSTILALGVLFEFHQFLCKSLLNSIKFRCNFFEVRNSDSASFCEIFVMSIESKCCKHGQYLSISDRYERSKQLQLKNIMKKHGHK